MINQLVAIIPEIMIAIIAMIMQIVGVYSKSTSKTIISFTAYLGLGVVLYLLFVVPPYYEIHFSGSFATSSTIHLFKALVIGLALMSIIIYRDLAIIRKKKARIEFITLMLLSVLGIFIAISARDFLILFCGLELQSLAGYALASFNTRDIKSSEAGLKYFVLGALMSCLMLLGISFLYGFSGSIKFMEVKTALASSGNIGLVVGCVTVMASMLFKLSVAPMHLWTPDVYEGAPTPALSYFASAQKLGILFITINILDTVIIEYESIANDLIKIAAILSMIIGSLGAIRQNSLKRLMAYSTILNVGYALIGVALRSLEGNNAAFVFMLAYIIGVVGFFSCLVALFGERCDTVTFDDLRGIASKRKTLAAVISIIMFSMIGLPPLAGFIGKYYLFYNAIIQGEIALVVTGILTSVIAAFYYLRVIKCMYFTDVASELKIISTKWGLFLVSAFSLSFTLFFCIIAYMYI